MARVPSPHLVKLPRREFRAFANKSCHTPRHMYHSNARLHPPSTIYLDESSHFRAELSVVSHSHRSTSPINTAWTPSGDAATTSTSLSALDTGKFDS